MDNRRIVSKFNGLMWFAVVISVLVSSAAITAFLLHRFNRDAMEKDRLHIKGLTGSVGALLDQAFSFNYQLSINPEIVKMVTTAPADWDRRVAAYNDRYSAVLTLSPDSGPPLLVQMQQNYPFVELLFVQDRNGDQVGRSYGPLGRRGSRWWFKKMAAGGRFAPFVSKSYYSMTGDKPVASAFHPIIQDGRVVGVMGTDLNFDRLQAMVQNYLASDDLFAIVLDHQGVIVAHPDSRKLREMTDLKALQRSVLVRGADGRILQDENGYHQTRPEPLDASPQLADTVQRVLGGNSGYAQDVVLDGLPCSLHYEPVPLPGASGDNYAILLIRSNASITRSKLAICGFALLLSATLTPLLILLFRAKFKRAILTPLNSLMDSMQRAVADRTGDPRQRWASGKDEFEILAETFVELRNQMGENNRKLSQMNQILEKRVARRTRDLLRLNQSLIKDIRRRRKLDADLRESEELQRRTIETAPDAISINRLKDGSYISVNQTFCDVSGFKREEVLGRTPMDLGLYTHRRDLRRVMGALKRKGEVDGMEVRFRDRAGQFHDCLISAKPMRYRNEDCLISVVTDITERKKVEDRVHRLNQELERRVADRTSQLERANQGLRAAVQRAHKLAQETEMANRSKSEFLANMSHEIRTPMNGIIGMSELMLNTPLNRKQREFLEVIDSSARLLLGILNDILDFSKIEAGKLEFEAIPFSLRDAVEETSDLFTDKLWKKGIELILEISPDLPKLVVSDPLRLRQVIVNLLSNAEKFTESGSIHVWVRKESDLGDDIRLLFGVRDTGIGIRPEDQSRLFEVFTQADGSTTRKYGGTGLGLTICRRIVEMLGGEIWIESAPDRGSTFYFTVKVKPLATEHPPSPLPSAFQNRTVLVVDDNDVSRRVCCRLLEAMNLVPLAAGTAEEGLKRYKTRIQQDREPIRMIIIDADLPDHSGLVALESFRAIPAEKPPRILLSSVSGEEKRLRTLRRARPNGILIKPLKNAALARTIKEAWHEADAHKPKPPIARPASRPEAGITLLLVEDNVVNRKVIAEMLSQVGIIVDTAVNGREALDRLHRRTYAAVLMDLQMPEMDGFEATRTIRENPDFGHLPIIAVTAHTMASDREKCISAGMNGFLAKPVDRQRLYDVIAENVPAFSLVRGKKRPAVDGRGAIPLNNYPGLDVRTALDRIGGSWELYAGLVREYCESFEAIVPELESLIHRTHFRLARQKAHSLKGAAGNISAMALFESARDLENALRSKDTDAIMHHLAAVANAFGQLSKTAESLPKAS
jgi:two-component system sensor histidine kinase/response regulator